MSTTTDTTTEVTTETPAKPLKARYLEQIVRERALERLTERVKKDRQNLDAELRDRYRDEGTTSVRLDHGGKKIGQPTVSITQPTARVTDEPAFTAWVAEHLGE